MEDNRMSTLTLQELEKNLATLVPDLQLVSKPPAIPNPFKSYLTISWLDILQMVLCSVLLPIRVVLLVITCLFVLLWTAIFTIGYKESTPPQPMTGWRLIGQKGLYVISRVVCFLFGFHNVKIKGKTAPEVRMRIGVPHSAFMDAFLHPLLGRTSGVSRIENENFITRLAQPTFVARADKKSKSSVVDEIKRKVADKKWPPTLIFVEGTCTNRRAYTFFKPGAFYPGVPVQPFIIRFPDCEDGMDYATWTWMGPGALKLALLMLLRLHNRAEIEVLPPYVPSDDEIKDPFLYARNVRDYIAKADNKPTTDHSFEDCRLMKVANQLNLPMEAALVEYYKISPMIDMNCDRMIENLKKFAQIDTKCDGVIDMDEFCAYLNLPPIEEVKTIFRIYDINKDGRIAFREYLLGSFLISKPFNSEENINNAFSLLDDNSIGYVTYEAYSNLLKRAMSIDEKYVKAMFEELDSERNGKPNFEQFKDFCLNKPEYAVLFIHFRNLNEKLSSMSYRRAFLRRNSSVEEFESLTTVYV